MATSTHALYTSVRHATSYTDTAPNMSTSNKCAHVHLNLKHDCRNYDPNHPMHPTSTHSEEG
jgi:hypothetical protein